MILDMLDSWPSDDKLGVYIKRWIVITVVSLALLNIFYYLSNSPMELLLAGQLSFSGEYIKFYIFNAPFPKVFDITYYTIAQFADLGFMFGYGGWFLFIGIRLGRKADTPKRKKLLYTLALLGVFAAVMDFFENLFIFAMLTAPYSFPDWLAVVHSCFSAVKWSLIVVTLLGLSINLLVLRRKKSD